MLHVNFSYLKFELYLLRTGIPNLRGLIDYVYTKHFQMYSLKLGVNFAR